MLLDTLAWKPDFHRTINRFEAWWRGEVLDRPPLTLHAPGARQPMYPSKTHADERQRWMDVEYRVEAAVAHMAASVYPADSFPIYWPNLGPEITATLHGCELEFGRDTSWTTPIVHSAEQWETFLDSGPDFDNLYWRTIERMTRAALDRCDGRFAVGITDLHGNYDILAALREPQELCLDLIDCPGLVARAAMHAAKTFVAAFERSAAITGTAGFAPVSWVPVYHRGPFYIPSCDFWCMVSNEMARALVLPSILAEMAPLDRSIFHLDGPGALTHLDALLEIPSLNAVQWVFGAGQGPARRWIDVYRRIRAAGKSAQILAQSPEDALAVLDAVGPAGLWICVGERFGSEQAAEDFAADIARRCRVA